MRILLGLFLVFGMLLAGGLGGDSGTDPAITEGPDPIPQLELDVRVSLTEEPDPI